MLASCNGVRQIESCEEISDTEMWRAKTLQLVNEIPLAMTTTYPSSSHRLANKLKVAASVYCLTHELCMALTLKLIWLFSSTPTTLSLTC